MCDLNGQRYPESRWDLAENEQTVLKSQKPVVLPIDGEKIYKYMPAQNTSWGYLEHAVSCEISPDRLWAFENSVKQLFK